MALLTASTLIRSTLIKALLQRGQWLRASHLRKGDWCRFS